MVHTSLPVLETGGRLSVSKSKAVVAYSLLGDYVQTGLIIRHRITDVVILGDLQDGCPAVLSRILVGKNATGMIPDLGAYRVSGAALADVAMKILEYLEGSPEDLISIPLEMNGYTPFRSAVLCAARKIPYGSTISYSALAGLSGFPRAERAAASVMRGNPFPLLIPCHRVIRKDGTAGGYCGDMHGPDAELKRVLIELERTHHDKPGE